MKTIILTLATLLVFSSSSLKANNPSPEKCEFKSTLMVAQNNFIIFRCVSIEDELISIQLEDSNHELLATKVLHEKGTSKISYSLGQLPIGTYYFFVYKSHKLIKRYGIEKQNEDQLKIVL